MNKLNLMATNLLNSYCRILSVLLLFLPCAIAHSETGTSGQTNASVNTMAAAVNIHNAWARATFSLAKTGAAYCTITNTSDKAIILKSVSVDAAVAMKTELHHTVMENNMMSMEELEDGVVIEAGASEIFASGGKHIMLMGLSGPLNKGESININLHFEDGSVLPQEFTILDKRKGPNGMVKNAMKSID